MSGNTIMNGEKHEENINTKSAHNQLLQITNSPVGCSEQRPKRVVFSNADAIIRKQCIQTAKTRYGVPLPDVINTRIEQELEAIKGSHHASQYIIGAMIAEQARIFGLPVTTRGMIGSVLVSFLCGITSVNPLPAHYFCPKCHHFELADGTNKNYRIMGYDLPDKKCPRCSNLLKADGVDILPEILMGIHYDREPEIILNVASEIRPRVIDYIKSVFGPEHLVRAGIKTMLKDGSIKRGEHPGGIFIVPKGTDINRITAIRDKIPNDEFRMRVMDCDYHEVNGLLKKYDLLTLPELNMLYNLEKETCFSADSIKTNDRDIMEVFLKEGFSFLPVKHYRQKSTCSKINIIDADAGCFSHLVKVNALLNGVGTFYDNGENLLKEGKKLTELIACRDDIMQYLLEVGMERSQAFNIMNNVRKGRGLTEEMVHSMKAAGVPDWYINSCKKIKYLFPKSHVVEYMLIYWKLAFYKLHFPDIYQRLLSDSISR